MDKREKFLKVWDQLQWQKDYKISGELRLNKRIATIEETEKLRDL